MIVEQEQTTLSPEEVGAFATQWAEHRKVGVEDLANRLGVDKSQAESLLRQAKGRLNMEAWMRKVQPKEAWWQSQWTMVGLGVFGGAILGCLLTKLFMPNPDLSNVRANPLPAQNFKTIITSPGQATPPSRPPRGSGPTPGPAIGMAVPEFHPAIRRGAGMAASPFSGGGGPMTHISQGGFVSSSKAKAKSYSMFLAASVPKNIMMQLELPGEKKFELQGQISKNYADAAQITDAEITAGIQVLLKQVMSEPAVQEASKDTKARLLVNLGLAVVSREIPWDAKHPAQLKKLLDPSSPVLGELSSSLVTTIQSYGPGLFPRPMPAAPGRRR